MVRATPFPLAVNLIDPGTNPGQGMAYSTTDPDHRLNAPAMAHSVLPEDIMHFTRWARAQGLAERDPEALWPDGGAYFRRRDFAAYLAQTLSEHAHWPATDSTITHLPDQAIAIRREPDATRVILASGSDIKARMVFLATGNPALRLPHPFEADWGADLRIVENPFAHGRLAGLNRAARVVILGAGLTALDALSSLLVQGHQGPISVISRRGLRPRPQAPIASAMAFNQVADDLVPGTMFLNRVLGEAPGFIPPTPDARKWLRALRQEVERSVAEGGTWFGPFDALRDSLWQIWPRLPANQKRLVLRQLRPWYDAHRFRTAPQNEALVAEAVSSGQVEFVSARLVSACWLDEGLTLNLRHRGKSQASTLNCDVLINATGLDTAAGIATNPLLADLLAQDGIRLDPVNLGLDVDLDGRAQDAEGQAHMELRIVGPPTLGTFGDPIGAIYIAIQIHRFLPAIFEDLAGLASGRV